MKKLLRNKKMLLPLIAGLLVFVAVLGAGTFAWFTGNDKVAVDGGFHTAIVGVEATELDFVVLDFVNGSPGTIFLQQYFENSFADPTQFGLGLDYLKSQYEFPFWPLVHKYQKDGIPSFQYGPFTIGFVENSFGVDGKKVIQNVTPGSMLKLGYSFDVEDKATIPVYFRMQSAELSCDSDDLAYIQDVFVTIKGTREFGVKDANGIVWDEGRTITIPRAKMKEVDGWWYCSLPLSPEYAWVVETTYIVYLYGEENRNDIQDLDITFANTTNDEEIEIEVIQATNNAVYFADGWADAAGVVSGIVAPENFFVNYFDDDYAMYQVYIDYVF